MPLSLTNPSCNKPRHSNIMSIISLIGNTPLVQITKADIPESVKLYAKLEGNNPAGSVNDRAAHQMIHHAMETGLLSKGDTLDQFNNPQNKNAHILTTGPEIWNDTQGEITHFVSSMGTTGTITGTSTYLKSKNQNIQIIGVQPTDGTRIPGIRKWSPEFLPGIYEPDRIDDILYVSKEEATDSARQLASQEGIFAGESSGGAYTIAKRIASTLTSGYIVFIACDRGDRYLTSPLYNF